MEKMRFFLLEAVTRPPTELIKSGEKLHYDCQVFLPLPPQLLVFSLGPWPGQQHGVHQMDIFLDNNRIGVISSQTKCFSWDVEDLHDLSQGDFVTLEVKAMAPESEDVANQWKTSKLERTEKKEEQLTPLSDTACRASQENVCEEAAKASSVKRELTPLTGTTCNEQVSQTNIFEDTANTSSVKPELTPLTNTACNGQISQTNIFEDTANTSSVKPEVTPLTDTTCNKQVSKTNIFEDNAKTSSLKPEFTPLTNTVCNRQVSQKNIFEEVGKASSVKPVFTPLTNTVCNCQASQKKAVGEAMKASNAELYQLDCYCSVHCFPQVQSPVNGKLVEDDKKSGETVTKKVTGVTDWKCRSNTEIDIEMSPQVLLRRMSRKEIKALTKKPTKKKRKQVSSDDLLTTPHGATPPKKQSTFKRGSESCRMLRSPLMGTALADTAHPDTEGSLSTAPALSDRRNAHLLDLPLMLTPQPTARWGHTLVLSDQRHAVLIGGEGLKEQLSKDSVWILDTATGKWENIQLKTDRQKSEYRTGHTATLDPRMQCIYIIGGSKQSRWFHDVHVFDLEDRKWSLIEVDGNPPTTAYHTTCFFRNELWVFGGINLRPSPEECSNIIYIFSPVMQNWYTPLVQGKKPLPRSGHSATLIDDQMAVFGGWDAYNCYNDLFILDLTTVDWSRPDVTGTPPTPRCWHASSPLSQRRIFIHGGFDSVSPLSDSYTFDLNSLSWSRLVIDGSPKARAGLATIFLPHRHDNQDEDEVMVFGGGDNQGGYFTDLQSFFIPITPVVQLPPSPEF